MFTWTDGWGRNHYILGIKTHAIGKITSIHVRVCGKKPRVYRVIHVIVKQIADHSCQDTKWIIKNK